MIDDLPLPGRSILRLVDQHMIDAAVELVMHPAGRNAVQHRQRLVDQIVIVEQAALLLLAAIIGGGRGRDVQQCLRPVAHGHGAAPFDQGAEANNFCVEQAPNDRILGDKIVRHDLCSRCAGIGEKYPEIFFDLCRPDER